jgi:hypothetical protein
MCRFAVLQDALQGRRLELAAERQQASCERRLGLPTDALGGSMLGLVARGLAVKPSWSAFFVFCQGGAGGCWTPCMLDPKEGAVHEALETATVRGRRPPGGGWSGDDAEARPAMFHALHGECSACCCVPAAELGAMEEPLLQWLWSRGYAAACWSSVGMAGCTPSPRIMRVGW